MQWKGLKPSTSSYTAAIDACSKGGQWQTAVALLHEMKQQRDVSVSVQAYTAATSSLSQSGQWQVAVQLLREMQVQTSAYYHSAIQ
jgi:pentatricopeptide repeat domain-containing protein 1